MDANGREFTRISTKRQIENQQGADCSVHRQLSVQHRTTNAPCDYSRSFASIRGKKRIAENEELLVLNSGLCVGIRNPDDLPDAALPQGFGFERAEDAGDDVVATCLGSQFFQVDVLVDPIGGTLQRPVV